MQEKSEKFSEYSERTEVLAKRLGINLSDLPGKMDISPSMFHAYRGGKYPISPKAWKKLEAAERAAGIISEGVQTEPENAESAGKVKDSEEHRTSNAQHRTLKEEEMDFSTLEVGRSTLDVLTRIAAALEEIAAKMKDLN